MQPGAAAPTHPRVTRFSSFVAIDWSGAKGARPRGIALARARADAPVELIEPAHGLRWSRADVLAFIEAEAASGADTLIGFDLSPTLPWCDAQSYFPGWEGAPDTPRGLWALVEALSADESDLTALGLIDAAHLSPYFRRHGGREGALFGGGIGRLRVVEHHQRASGQARSASSFNLVGAAQVGKASLSGMRLFHRLAGRVPFWPFDPLPTRGTAIIEIYTSLAARAAGLPPSRSKVRDHAALREALTALGASTDWRGAIDDHRADALITAAWLRAVADDAALWNPAPMTAEVAAREGWTFGIT